MTVAQAAKVIGCHPAHIRKLIKAKKLKAKLKSGADGRIKWWELDSRSVRSYAKRPQTGGWPRGVSRT